MSIQFGLLPAFERSKILDRDWVEGFVRIAEEGGGLLCEGHEEEIPGAQACDRILEGTDLFAPAEQRRVGCPHDGQSDRAVDGDDLLDVPAARVLVVEDFQEPRQGYGQSGEVFDLLQAFF